MRVLVHVLAEGREPEAIAILVSHGANNADLPLGTTLYHGSLIAAPDAPDAQVATPSTAGGPSLSVIMPSRPFESFCVGCMSRLFERNRVVSSCKYRTDLFVQGGKNTMTLTVTQFIIWLIVAAIIGLLGELIAGRRAPDGILGSIMVGLFAIFLIVGFFHFSIQGEPKIGGVPIISTLIAAAMIVALWSSLSYRFSRPR
jgi:uncharacterized membrane protein YeaQ/YmgE (transglycosylase-associated protein family)